jgi:heme/copper-type cytochrome/quinol oxidase subunit 2
MPLPTIPALPTTPGIDLKIELSPTAYIVIAVIIIVLGSILLAYLCWYFRSRRRMQPEMPAQVHEPAPAHMGLLPDEAHSSNRPESIAP